MIGFVVCLAFAFAVGLYRAAAHPGGGGGMRFHVLVDAEVEADDIDGAMALMRAEFDLDREELVLESGEVQVHSVSDCEHGEEAPLDDDIPLGAGDGPAQ